ncbi:uncharacterized protein [Euwallacea similis]|uniref:uncharacterized protein n=1 Tax=Euwallacea similis TaxID=1736056 RepID=UPI00344E6E28
MSSSYSGSTDCCRLCMATKNLLSMFTGKCRKPREFLRKIIFEMLNIKIEQTDQIMAVCFNCLVDVTSFYDFKLRCLQNQDNLEAALYTPPLRKQRLTSCPLEKLSSPGIDSTLDIFHWLSLKRVSLTNENAAQNISKLIDKGVQVFPAYSDGYSQCDQTQTKSAESQTLFTSIREVSVQTDSISLTGNCTQTDMVQWKTKTLGIQTHNHKHMKNRRLQTDFSELNTRSGTEKLKSTDRMALNDSQINQYKKQRPLNDKITFNCSIPIVLGVEKVDKECQVELLRELPSKEIMYQSVQTDNVKLINKSTQYCAKNTFPSLQLSRDKSFLRKRNENLTDSSTYTNVIVKSTGIQCDFYDYLGQVYNKLTSPPNEDFQIEVKEEKFYPLGHLTIATSPLKTEILSPTSSDLLQVKTNKSRPVKICHYCDKVSYSKSETLTHRKTHMQCHICKKKFASIRATQFHVDSCKLDLVYTPRELENYRWSPVVSLKKLEDQLVSTGEYPQVSRQLRDMNVVGK